MTPVPIAGLIPHGGAMVLLDEVLRWNGDAILCRTRTHLDPANPLRRAGGLSAVCALEYGMQAAALHGALRDGAPQRRGFVARLRNVALHVPRLDDPGLGALHVSAVLDRAEPGGTVYSLRVTTEAGGAVADAGVTIALPLPAGDAAARVPATPGPERRTTLAGPSADGTGP